MTESTPALTQSGLLAVLLQRQRYKLIQLVRRRAYHKRCVFPFGIPSIGRGARSRHQCWSTPRATLESFTRPIAMSHQIHTYTELRQQIHDDLRIQHPDWIKSNGESPMCDSYESRLMELLDRFTRTGSDESVAALQQGLN